MRRILILTLALGPVALSGCAMPMQPESMTVGMVTAIHKSQGTVAVAVSGGRETSQARESRISNDAFRQALTRSIEGSGLFAGVGAEDQSRYVMTAFIGNVQSPLFGLTAPVVVEVTYTLKDRQAATVVWKKNVASTHTPRAGDAFLGVERYRLAKEVAAKENIRLMMEAVSALKLP